jgi:hypothetical protein
MWRDCDSVRRILWMKRRMPIPQRTIRACNSTFGEISACEKRAVFHAQAYRIIPLTRRTFKLPTSNRRLLNALNARPSFQAALSLA